MSGAESKWRVAFLMVNSRSGSTYVSRAIHEHLPDVAVPPEIDLGPAVEAWERAPLSAESARRALDRGRFFAALEASGDDFESRFVAEFNRDLPRAVRAFIDQYGSDHVPSGGVIVLKKGTHAFKVAQLLRWFPEASFVSLHRDPRAVYESKRRTPRPYRPGQTMAWLGVFGSAVRWQQFTQAMLRIEKEHGGPVLTYERFMGNEIAELQRLADYWGVSPPVADGTNRNYIIPVREQQIHSGATAGTFDAHKRTAWRTELSDKDVWVTEWLTRASMARLGYDRTAKAGVRAPWWLLTSAIQTAACVVHAKLKRRS